MLVKVKNGSRHLGLHEPAIIMLDLRLCDCRKFSHRQTTMHNIFLPPMLLRARLRQPELLAFSFHILIFQTLFFSWFNLDAAPSAYSWCIT